MRGTGSALFVAILLLVAGVVNLFYGFGAIANSHFFTGEAHYVLANANTWGWVTVILGAIQLFAGVSLLGGGTFGRVIGLVAASFGAVGALLAIGGAYPFWSLAVFALCVICIHGLIVLGEPLED
jgi:hypothetical protein